MLNLMLELSLFGARICVVKYVTHEYWRHSAFGRQYSEPWSSLTSLNRKARAVAYFRTGYEDLDMGCAHQWLALAICISLGESGAFVGKDWAKWKHFLSEYVNNRPGFIKRVVDIAKCTSKAAKQLFTSLLNPPGCVEGWQRNNHFKKVKISQSEKMTFCQKVSSKNGAGHWSNPSAKRCVLSLYTHVLPSFHQYAISDTVLIESTSQVVLESFK